MSVHDTQNPDTREDALQAAVDAVRAGKLIVLPTETVYGIGGDAFAPDAVAALLDAKGRGRDTPPPVLVGDPAVLLALAVDVPDYVEDLTDAFWPGPLTLILSAQPSLTWDLGETRGTVALRMPDDELALELLRRTGPLAVSSANRHGRPAAQTVLDAATQLGDAVEEYLDGGAARLGTSSTILDATVVPPEIVRVGAVTQEEIVEAVGDIFAVPEPQPSEQDENADQDPADADADADADAEVDAGSPDGSDGPDDPDTGDGSEGSHRAAPHTDGTSVDAGGTDVGQAPEGRDDTPQAVSDPAADATQPAADQSAVGGTQSATGQPAAGGLLNLPSEPDLEDLTAESTAPERPLSTSDESIAPSSETQEASDPAPGGRTENSPG